MTYGNDEQAHHSCRRKRLAPPILSKVCKQVALVYLFSICAALWMALPVPFALRHIVIDDRRGKGRLGSGPAGGFTFLGASIAFFSLFAMPRCSMFCSYESECGSKNLLPTTGRTRVLSLFFMRVIVVFILFYVPTERNIDTSSNEHGR